MSLKIKASHDSQPHILRFPRRGKTKLESLRDPNQEYYLSPPTFSSSQPAKREMQSLSSRLETMVFESDWLAPSRCKITTNHPNIYHGERRRHYQFGI